MLREAEEAKLVANTIDFAKDFILLCMGFLVSDYSVCEVLNKGAKLNVTCLNLF